MDKGQKAAITAKYPVGTRVKLISMFDSFAVEAGTTGSIDYIDDAGTLHMKWDDGRTLGLILGIDQFEVI